MALNKIFKSRQTNHVVSSTEALLQAVKSVVNSAPSTLFSKGRRVAAFESLDQNTQDALATDIDGLETSLIEAVSDEEVGEQNLIAAQDAVAAVAAATGEEGVLYSQENPAAVNDGVAIESFSTSNLARRRGDVISALESYDSTENRNTSALSFVYNLKASRQDEFGEAFYPMVSVAPDVASATVTVDLLNVLDDIRRDTNGKFEHQWNRKSLINALVYPDILHNDTTKNYPVFRDGVAENEANFVDKTKIAPETIDLEDGQKVVSSWLRVGAEFDLLALSATDYILSGGRPDYTDNLDPSMMVEALLIELADGSLIPLYNLNSLPESEFTPAYQGNDRDAVLNFDTRFVSINANTKKSDGSLLTGPFATSNYQVNLRVIANGKFNIETSVGGIHSGAVKVSSIYNANKERIDIESGAGKIAADQFKDAKVIGYKLDSRRINTSRRERGQLLDINRERKYYSIKTLCPISIVRPASETTNKESARLDSLIATTFIRCSNAAVNELLRAEQYLASLPPVYEPELLYSNEALGVGRFFLNRYFRSVTLDVLAELNTLRTNDRILDVNAVMVNTIRELVFDAYLESNYKAAAAVLNGDNGNRKPLIIIGADPKIAAYLQIQGDTRTLGDSFEFKIVSTPNIKVRNKIYIGFGKPNAGANDAYNPLNHGNMFWRPEIVTDLQISRNGATSRELTVQPSFRHVTHSNVLMSITVTNLADAVTKMVPVFTKTAP